MMNIAGLLEPILRLLPAPTAAGASSAVKGLASIADVESVGRQLEGYIANGIHGQAGHAVTRNVNEAMRAVHSVIKGGNQLDDIAREAVVATQATGTRIMTIARECFAQLSGALHGSMLLNPPTAMATLLPIAMTHWGRAEAEIEELGATLRALTAKVKSTHLLTPRAEATNGEVVAQKPVLAHPTGPLDKPSPSLHTAAMDGGALAPSTAADRAVTAAKSALGTPYQWGGNVPGQGLDCSGLTQWAYKQAGIDLPRTTDAQAIGPQIPQHQVRPGDLAVWDGHVAMVVDNGRMIEAGDPVQINPIRRDNIGMAFKGFYRPTAA